jgi:capsular exopolysaccharide synthesis family protein
MIERRTNGKALVHASDVSVVGRSASPAARAVSGGIEGEVRTYLDILRRRGKWIVWTLFLVVSAALAYTLLKPAEFRATALLEMRGGADASSIEELFPDADPTERSLLTRFGLMRSETLALRVIDELRLDTIQEFNPQGTATHQQLVNGFLERLVVDPVEESRLVSISFAAGTPELSARIANATVSAYARLRVESREDAARRVGEQARAVEARLAASQDTLRAYAQSNGLPYLVEEDLAAQISGRLGDLRTRLANAEAERYERESLYDVVVGQGRVDLLQDEGLSVLMLRLSELRREHARLSATFTDAYPAAAELTRQIAHVRELITEEQVRLSGRIESDYRLARQREGKLVEALDSGEVTANELGPQSGEYYVLRQAVIADRAVYATLLDRKRQAEIVAAIGATDIAVIDDASPPTSPYRPIFGLNMGLASMLGLVLGLGLAFGRELTDDTVQTAEDFPLSGHVPVLALIPSVGDDVRVELPALGAGRKRSPPWSAAAPGQEPLWLRIDTVDRQSPTGNALADSFGALRTAVLFKNLDPAPRSILVTSCRAGEGKTTVSVNFAMSLAQVGKRVLLVDADLRKPAVHRALRIPSSPGMVNCLSNGAPWQDLVQYQVAPGLDVLTSGGSTRGAGDLLAGAALGPILRQAESRYDFVIVDAPALFINASDARVLSSLVDGVVVVVRARVTPRALVDRIPRSVPNVIGIVMNDLRKGSLPGYYAEYFDDYRNAGSQGVTADAGWGGPEIGVHAVDQSPFVSSSGGGRTS